MTRPVVTTTATRPLLASALIALAIAAAPSAQAAEHPAETMTRVAAAAGPVLERAHADDGWQRQDYAHFARGDGLAGELVSVAADPGAGVTLDDPFTPARALRQFAHNAGARLVDGASGRLRTVAGTFFWQGYELPASGEGCAAFEGMDAGRRVVIGYACREGGDLPADGEIAATLDDVDPTVAPAASAPRLAGDDPAGVPGWPLMLARHHTADQG